MDFDAIKAKAEGYRADMTKFLRDLIRIPGESADEEGHSRRIKEEMEKDIIRDESEVVHWSADAYLRTEESKDWYYNQVRMLNLDSNVPVKMLLVELANLKFKRE